MSVEPAPIVVDASGEFDGVDGSWSTFQASVGTPPQPVRVLVATEVSSAWITASDACQTQGALGNCTKAHGGVYDSSQSSSWNRNGPFGLGDESNLGYAGKEYTGTFGYDTIGIQGKGANVSVDHQVIATIASNHFFVGTLGLSSSSINFTQNPDTESSPSLLTSLKNQNLIPSLSYGYTAGASYQQKNGALGSLTLGGYDASRFIPNEVSFDFAPADKRQLQVGLKAVTQSTSKGETSLLSQSALALVDSTVPYLWLPESACQAFEKAFNLTRDGLTTLYLIDDDHHDTLLKQNASVIFELANNVNGGGPSINITLPYASFDLMATSPLIKNPSRYFPLQRANDDDAITLGRTFLQEAFLIVNYEHSNFSVSQAVFDPNAQSHIVSLASVSTTATPSPTLNPTSTNGPIVQTTPQSSSHGKGIGIGAIAGIVVAVVIIAALSGAWFLYRRYKKSPKKDASDVESSEPKVLPDDDDDSKRDFAALEVNKPKAAIVTVNDVRSPMTPPAEIYSGDSYFPNEKSQAQSQTAELPISPGTPPNRSELSTPEPWASELSSPELEALHSQLSTPDPELSTPDPLYSRTELESPGLGGHGMPSSPGLSSLSSGHPSPPTDDGRSSALRSPAQLPLHRPLSDRMDSSESEAGWTRDGFPGASVSFHRRYASNDSLSTSSPSRPLSSRMDSSDSEGLGIRHARFDESEESEAVVSPITTTRRNPTHLDSSSDSDSIPQPPATAVALSRARPAAIQVDSSSSADPNPSPSPLPNPNRRRIMGLTTPFYSSSNSRPAIRRSIHDVTSSRRRTMRTDSTDSADSEAWKTRLESASTEGPDEVSRLPSGRRSSSVER